MYSRIVMPNIFFIKSSTFFKSITLLTKNKRHIRFLKYPSDISLPVEGLLLHSNRKHPMVYFDRLFIHVSIKT